MQIRTTAPDALNKYYIQKSHGGYSPCIEGNNAHHLRPFAGSVLPNCVGAATARFAEIQRDKGERYLGNTNAENFYRLAKSQGLSVGSKPKPGAVMVWKDGKSGVGHVACVEQTNWTDQVLTFESGWGYTNTVIRNVTRKKGTGSWGLSGYKFLGFIYNPGVVPYKTPTSTVKKGTKGDAARFVQWCLWKDGCFTSGKASEIDGSFGNRSVEALRKFQKKYGLEADGHAGAKTRKKMQELYTLE